MGRKLLCTSLSPNEISLMFRLVFHSPYPLVKVCKICRLDAGKVYRFLKTEHGRKFFLTWHDKDKFGRSKGLWVSPNYLNLIKLGANFKAINFHRKQAINKVTEVKGFGFYDKKRKRYKYTNDVYKRINIDFAQYKIECNSKSLVFCSANNNWEKGTLVLPYITRFTDKVRAFEIRKKYDDIWAYAAALFACAIMVTLTIDPERVTNLWEANKIFMKKMNKFRSFVIYRIKAEKNNYIFFSEMYNDCIKNKINPNYEYLKRNRHWYMRKVYSQIIRDDPTYMSYSNFKEHVKQNWIDRQLIETAIKKGYAISKKFKDIPDDYQVHYLNVLEFQKNGRLHAHLVIYGLNYLMPVKELSRLWDSYEIGKHVHVYEMKSDGKNFLWGNRKPEDTRNKSPTKYLMEYLLKAQYSTACNYWCYNTRFYTNSRNFEKSLIPAIERKRLKNRPSYYKFIGTIRNNKEDSKRIRYLSIKEYVNMAGYLLDDPPVAVSVS
jgi:hypothetical protein